MKSVVKEYTSHELISVRDIINHINPQKIIAYRPNGRKEDSLAILVQQHGDFNEPKWGWVYHSDMVRNVCGPLYFIGDCKRRALINALDANREILLFSTFHEFVTYAGNLSKPA